MRKPFASLLLFLSFWTGCQHNTPYREVQVLMGTLVEVRLPSSNRSRALLSQESQDAFEAIREVDRRMSVYQMDSDISRINQNAGGEAVPVSPETYKLLKASVHVSEQTDGCFDVTVGPLVKLWGFQREGPAGPRPSDSDIAEAKSHVGSRNIIFDEATHGVGLKEAGMEVDLGGIAKGFAVDQAIKTLRSHGIENATVAASGDIFCLGRPSPARPWRIWIRHPLRTDAVIAALELTDQAISTSGVTEKNFSEAGKTWSHLIDPRSGYPVQHSLLSVTVIAPHSWLADAASTAFLVCGREASVAFLERLGDIEAVFVEETPLGLQVGYTEGLKDRLLIQEEE